MYFFTNFRNIAIFEICYFCVLLKIILLSKVVFCNDALSRHNINNFLKLRMLRSLRILFTDILVSSDAESTYIIDFTDVTVITNVANMFKNKNLKNQRENRDVSVITSMKIININFHQNVNFSSFNWFKSLRQSSEIIKPSKIIKLRDQ